MSCRKVLPVCHIARPRLVLNRLALSHFVFSRFATFARQWAMSPQGFQPSRCGGAPAPTVTACLNRGEPSLVTSSAAPWDNLPGCIALLLRGDMTVFEVPKR